MVINTSDADIVSAFTGSENVQTVVTWNPQLSEILRQPDTKRLCDSSQIPGEIVDLMVVNTETLTANHKFGMALVGARYELMATMAKEDEAGNAVRSAMAKASGTDLAGQPGAYGATVTCDLALKPRPAGPVAAVDTAAPASSGLAAAAIDLSRAGSVPA